MSSPLHFVSILSVICLVANELAEYVINLLLIYNQLACWMNDVNMDTHQLGDPWLSSDDSGVLRKYRNHPHVCFHVYTMECKHKICLQQKSRVCIMYRTSVQLMRYA